MFVVEAVNIEGFSRLVGVYSTFEKAKEGRDAHKLWFNSSEEYYITNTLLDRNHTRECIRDIPFNMAKPPTWLEK